MTTYSTLTCERRIGTGSNASRKLRSQGKLPATVYGHGAPLSLVLDLHEFTVVERASDSGSQLLQLSIDGAESALVLVKSVQRNTLKRLPIHVDLQRVSLTEQLQVTVNVQLTGDPAGVTLGGRLEVILRALHLSCAAGSVPDNLTHDISAMGIGDTLDAGAIALPDGCVLLDKPEERVALIRQPLRTGTTAAAETA